MAIQTRNVTVTINDVNGDLVENARVVIKLRGLGNGPNGAVAPNTVEQYTDASGQTVFELWENRPDYSDTYYEVSSYHPDGYQIHRREIFRVYDSDANLAELISLGLVDIDLTQALADQVAADRAAAASSASTAQNAASIALVAQGEAETAALQSEQYKNDAQGYATAAQQSASNASSSEIVVANLRDEAEGHANAAAVSEANALQYSNTAVAASTQAENDAQDASDSAAAAQSSATSAGSSASAAEDAADDALDFRNAAQAAATTATIKASEASDSALNAASAESGAEGFANASESSATSSANSASAAEGFKDDAETAKNLAEAAAASVNNLLNGDGAPSAALGDEDDYYLDNVAIELYGPKTAGSWGTPVGLVGPQGDEGPPGPAGTGTGDVNGPATSSVNNLALFGNNSGDLLKEGPALSTLIFTSDVASTAEAEAGTAGKILDAAGGIAQLAKYGVSSLSGIAPALIGDVVNQGSYYITTNDPTDKPTSRYSFLDVKVYGAYVEQNIRDRLDPSENFYRYSSDGGTTWEPWESVVTSSRVATIAEASAGTSGKLLDAAGGMKQLQDYGVASTSYPNYPLSDMDADPTGVPSGSYRIISSLQDNIPFGVANGTVEVDRYSSGVAVITFTTLNYPPRRAMRIFATTWRSTWEADEYWTAGNLQKTSSNTDTTAGRVPTVGWMGQGMAIQLTSSDDLLSLPSIGSGANVNYVIHSGDFPANTPDDATVGGGGDAYVSRTQRFSSRQVLVYTDAYTGAKWRNTQTGGTWSGWKPIATPNGLGTAAELDAVSSLIDTTAGRAVTTGWMGFGSAIGINSSSDLENLPALDSNSNAFYRYSSGSLPANVPTANSAFFQRVYFTSTTEILKLVTTTGEEYKNVKLSGTWSGWLPVGSGGGSGFSGPPEFVFDSSDETSNSITATVDCDEGSAFMLNFNDPSISTSGSFIIDINNIPTSGDQIYRCSIQMMRAGRKPTLTWLLAGGLTVEFLGATTYRSGDEETDVVEFYWSPMTPSKVFFTKSDSRT
ncbi:hypothetical protein [uncultured Gilvimarinus sp.]|uniref:hypothetical protein n=1 Tax=uncultured Gilvimarinus sp. TaxID=1689143 RepID=UPI0030EBCE00